MGEFELEKLAKYSTENPVATDLCDSKKATVSLLCLEKDQVALEDTKDNKIAIIINTGSGSIVTEEGEYDVDEGTFVLFEMGEARLFKAKTKSSILVTTLRK